MQIFKCSGCVVEAIENVWCLFGRTQGATVQCINLGYCTILLARALQRNEAPGLPVRKRYTKFVRFWKAVDLPIRDGVHEACWTIHASSTYHSTNRVYFSSQRTLVL